MPLTLVTENDPILHEKLEPFDFSNPPTDPALLFAEMKETMIRENGLGLSACQVGLRYRMFVMGNPSDPDSIFPVFNPRIINTSDNIVLMEEGCLSFPMLYIKVKRPDKIKVRYASINGETDTHTFQGTTARVFQHEYDHMEGVLFLDRANRYHIDQGKKRRTKFLKMKKKNDETLMGSK